MTETLRPLWTCPRCGKPYVNRNSWHSCIVWPVEAHFEGKGRARELFDAFRRAVEADGPVTMVSNKTNLGFMTRARFAGVQIRRDRLTGHVWLKRQVDSPRIVKVERYGPYDFVHRFEIREEADIDDELRALLCEARAVGDQAHEQQARRYRATVKK